MDEEPDPIATEKSVPIPERLTVVDPPAALCWMVTAALQVPVESGRNVTLIVQLAPAFRLAPQLSVLGNSAASAPVTDRLAMLSVEPPVLVSVIVWAALVVFTIWAENVKLIVERLTAGGVMPLPLSGIECGLPEASLAMETAADLAPEVAGAKATLIVQFALTARVAPQAFVSAN